MSTAETDVNAVAGTGEGAAEGAVPEDLDLRVEAALLTADRPMTGGKLGALLGGVGAKAISEAVGKLNAVYIETGRSFRVEQLAGGWQIVTLAAYGHILSAMHRSRAQSRLSPAGLETLAIVAYKQPVLRAEVEAIRGVASGEVLRSLMDRRLIKIAGRAEVIGRPILYGTTKAFLEVFGLRSVKDLPKTEELQAPDGKRNSKGAMKVEDKAAPDPPPTPPTPPATSDGVELEKSGAGNDEGAAVEQV